MNTAWPLWPRGYRRKGERGGARGEGVKGEGGEELRKVGRREGAGETEEG